MSGTSPATSTFFPGDSLVALRKYLAHAANASGTVRGQPLEEHLRNVAALAEDFAAKAGIPLCGRLVGLLHDFGKYSDEFQAYLRSATGMLSPEDAAYVDAAALKGKIVHSFAGGQHIWRRWERAAKPGVRAVAQFLSLCVISHHSGLKDCITPDGANAFATAMHRPEASAHHDQCQIACETALAAEIEELLAKPALQELASALGGVQTMHEAGHADGKNSQAFCRGLLVRFLLSCLLDADRTDTAAFEDSEWPRRTQSPCPPWNTLVQRLETYLAGLAGNRPIDDLRREISDACARRAADAPGLFTLTVPTGGGKTLASLRFALLHAQRHGLDRVIYVIPYTSIIDQNAAVARAILERDAAAGSVVLEHHANFLPDEDAEDEDAVKRWERLTETWDAPVIFTTMVQFLETLFGSGARRARRMHNLARSVLVFDEVQTVPLRCLHMFCLAVEFLTMRCGSSAVLCTATQPGLDKVPNPAKGCLRLVPEGELMPDVPRLFRKLRRTEFILHCEKQASLGDVAALAAEELQEHGACLVICNTKKAAEAIYSVCPAGEAVSRCYLSTSLCPAHRLEKLKQLHENLREGRPVLCVSTQLIECGVDVSFPSVIRLAAGLDSVLQAAGRCNRHGEGERPGRVHVVWAEENGLEFLPDIRHGQQIFLDMLTQCGDMLLACGNDLTKPELLAWYFTSYFQRREKVLSYCVAARKDGHVRDDTLLSMLGSNGLAPNNLPEPLLRQSFASAARLFSPIESQSVGVIVPYGEPGGEGETLVGELFSSAFSFRKRELLRKAQRYAVNVFPHTLQALQRAGAVREIGDSGILVLDRRFYSEEYGLVTQPVSALPLLNL